MDERRSLFQTVALLTAGCTVVLVGLGGYVRATGAGLSCPDWPLCYGRAIPPHFGDGIFQEVTHRYIAGAVSTLTALLIVISFRQRRQSPENWRWGSLLAGLLLLQVILGGLTVLWLLNPFIVAGHLLTGTLFLQTLIVAASGRERLRYAAKSVPDDGISGARFAATVTGLFSLLILCQIGLGGFMAASGSSLACVDLPLCQGAWLPAHASPQQLLHMGHRYLGLCLLSLAFCLLIPRGIRRTMGAAHFQIFAVLLAAQLVVGGLNVYFYVPHGLAVLHLLIAQFLLGWSVRMFRFFRIVGRRARSGVSVYPGAAHAVTGL